MGWLLCAINLLLCHVSKKCFPSSMGHGGEASFRDIMIVVPEHHALTIYTYYIYRHRVSGYGLGVDTRCQRWVLAKELVFVFEFHLQ